MVTSLLEPFKGRQGNQVIVLSDRTQKLNSFSRPIKGPQGFVQLMVVQKDLGLYSIDGHLEPSLLKKSYSSH